MQIGTHHSLADLTTICSVQVEDVQWLHTALAQEIHSDLVHWCISSMHIQPELKHAWPRGCQTNHAGQARQTHFSATFAESEHLCVPRWQGVAGGGHTHTHKQSDTSFSWDGRIPQNKLDNCHVAFSCVVETWAYQLFDCLVPLWSHSCTLAFVIMDGDLLQIYRWTLPGKKPNKSQQHGCSFPTSTATRTHVWEYL